MILPSLCLTILAEQPGSGVTVVVAALLARRVAALAEHLPAHDRKVRRVAQRGTGTGRTVSVSNAGLVEFWVSLLVSLVWPLSPPISFIREQGPCECALDSHSFRRRTTPYRPVDANSTVISLRVVGQPAGGQVPKVPDKVRFFLFFHVCDVFSAIGTSN
jgi:hypothetical protein